MNNTQFIRHSLSRKKLSLLLATLSTCSLLNTDPCLSMMRTHDNDNLSPRPTKRQRTDSQSAEGSFSEYSHGSVSESKSKDDSESEDIFDNDSDNELSQEAIRNMYKLGRQKLASVNKRRGMRDLEQVIIIGDAHYAAKAHYYLGLATQKINEDISWHLKAAAEAGYAPAEATYGLLILNRAKQEQDPEKKRRTMGLAGQYLTSAESNPKGAYTLGVLYKKLGNIRKAEELLKRSETDLTGTKKAFVAYQIAGIILDKIIKNPHNKVHGAEFNTYIQKTKAEEGLVEQAETLEATFNELPRTISHARTSALPRLTRAETMKDCRVQSSVSEQPNSSSQQLHNTVSELPRIIDPETPIMQPMAIEPAPTIVQPMAIEPAPTIVQPRIIDPETPIVQPRIIGPDTQRPTPWFPLLWSLSSLFNNK